MERVRDAATVILVRDCVDPHPERPGDDLEVFVLRRNSTLVFVPGATVFPGGAVDPDDRVVAAELGVDEFRAAAARECMEEAGIPVDPRALIEFAALDHARRRASPLRHALLRRPRAGRP